MKVNRKILMIGFCVLAGCSQRKQDTTIIHNKFIEDWQSLSEANIAPEWFRDAKFGIYTHWGPVSGVFDETEEGEYYDGWHGMFMYCNKGRLSWMTGLPGTNSDGTPDTNPTTNYLHHKKRYGDPAEFGYRYVIEQFSPTAFNAREWAELFAKSGAKFAGNVAMHHDNFAMWNSKVTRWNSMNYGGVDVSKELKKEIEQKGMKYIASFHHAFTWKYYAPAHMYTTIDSADYDLYTEPHDITSNTPTDRFLEEWWAKLKEFIDIYEPDLIWFDWWLENIEEHYRKTFLAYYYNKGLEWEKDVVVTFKSSTFPESVAIRDYERGRPNQPKPAWLTDTSPGAWFYRQHTEFKEAGELIDVLVDIVSKNGCMLLNVPPNPDGSIPEEMKDLLIKMGEWLKINGEAIYNTRPWTIFGEGPTRIANGGHKVEERTNLVYTNKDIRFTRKSDTELYAVVLDSPQHKIVIKSLSTMIGALNNDVEKVELLGSEEQIEWERNEQGLVIKSPDSFPTEYAHAFKITLKEPRERDITGDI